MKTKQEWRLWGKQQLKRYQDTKLKKQYEYQMRDQLWKSTSYQQARTLAIYWPLAGEFDTRPVINQALKEGKEVLLPVVQPQQHMIFAPYGPLVNRHGIMEPQEIKEVVKANIDLIIVPGLCFDAKGYRIGYGGGYYDRYLADYAQYTASFVFPYQQVENLPVDDFDRPIQQLITIKGVSDEK